MRKVSKQVAMGFIERTLVRCKNFELTGRSCFSEPALQNVLFASSQVNEAGAVTATDGDISHGAPKCRMDATKTGIILDFIRRKSFIYPEYFEISNSIS